MDGELDDLFQAQQRPVRAPFFLSLLILVVGMALMPVGPIGAQDNEGTVGGQYSGKLDGSPVRMTLRRDGNKLSGSYTYTRAGETLRLQGTQDGDRFVLRETYGRNAWTGTLRGHIQPDGSLVGTWTRPKGRGMYSFRLAPVGRAALSRHDRDRTEIRTHRAAQTAGEPFLKAVRSGNADRAQALLEKGAPVNARDKDGKTALILACTFLPANPDAPAFSSLDDRIEFVRYLIAQGADVNARTRLGYTPLMYAVASNGSGDKIVDLLLNAGAEVNARNVYEGTALMIATGKYGDPNTVRLLIDAGANIHARDKYGHTALWYARSHHADEISKILKEAGAED